MSKYLHIQYGQSLFPVKATKTAVVLGCVEKFLNDTNKSSYLLEAVLDCLELESDAIKLIATRVIEAATSLPADGGLDVKVVQDSVVAISHAAKAVRGTPFTVCKLAEKDFKW